MKYKELKDLTAQELTAKSRDLRQEIFNLRLQQASSQLEKPAPPAHDSPRHRADRNARFPNCGTRRQPQQLNEFVYGRNC